MKPNIEELRKNTSINPPEGMTSKDIRNMSEDELLDMDYFLNEDDLFADEVGCRRLLYLLTKGSSLSMPASIAGFFNSGSSTESRTFL